ncbi:MAG: hypothetical protein CSA65_00850 [Proteobacteria bacterium]|nr:MAG: hypothetical protein CSA65_00850 [Pseudomonadota bacterium]
MVLKVEAITKGPVRRAGLAEPRAVEGLQGSVMMSPLGIAAQVVGVSLDGVLASCCPIGAPLASADKEREERERSCAANRCAGVHGLTIEMRRGLCKPTQRAPSRADWLRIPMVVGEGRASLTLG